MPNFEERPISTRYAFCSLLLPGLGQLLQKRPGAAIGFFVLFILTAFLLVLIVSLLFMDRFSYQPLRVHVIHILIFGGLCIPLMLAYFWMVMDAAGIPINKPKEKQEEKPEKEQKKRTLPSCAVFLTVIAIIGILVVLLLPSFPAAREAARRMMCSNNMKQIVIAFHDYHEEHGHFPPAYSVDEDGKPLHSWRVLILPYIEQEALYEQIRLDEPWDSEYNRQFHEAVPGIFLCRSNPQHNSPDHSRRESAPYIPSLSGSTYSVVYGADAAFTGSQPTEFEDMKSGVSNTIVLVERRTPVNWMNPLSDITFETACRGINVDAMGISSYHAGGVNAAFGNGSVRFVSDHIDLETLRALLTVGNNILL